MMEGEVEEHNCGESDTKCINCTLPVEIRDMIFNWISQNEVMPLSRVCKDWKKEIESLYNFEINLDNPKLDEEILKNLLKCKVKSFGVGVKGKQLESVPISQLQVHDWAGGAGGSNVKSLFKYPQAMRTLDVPSIQNMSQENTLKLIEECSAHVETFHLIWDKSWDEEFLWPQMNFTNVKNIHFWHKLRGGSQPQINHILMEILENVSSSSSGLKKVRVDIDSGLGFEMDNEYALKLFQLIEAHSKSLDEFCVEYKWTDRQLFNKMEEGAAPSQYIIPFQMEGFDKVKSLKKLHLDYYSHSHGCSLLKPVKAVSPFWNHLIGLQNKLEEFEIHFIEGFTYPSFFQMVSNNYSTLRRLNISFDSDYNYSMGEEDEQHTLDMSLIPHCIHLQEMELTSPFRYLNLTNSQEIKNFNLPTSLEILSIKGFRIASAEFKSCFEQEFNELIPLHFDVMSEHGKLKDVHKSDLEIIMNHQKLLIIDIYQNRDLFALHFDR